MPKINLLPWREELRQKRKKDFLAAVLGAVLFGGLVVYGTKWVLGERIENQRGRNAILQEEIRILDEQIEEISGLRDQRERLLARMRIIEELQRSRPLAVHLFDEIVDALPEGMHLTSIDQTNESVEFEGIATSTTRVASLMRNIEDSEWLNAPQLGSIRAVTRDDTGRTSQFTVTARQISTKLTGGEGVR